MRNRGKVEIYLLFLIVGMTIGFFSGGEVIRRIYTSWFFKADSYQEQNTFTRNPNVNQSLHALDNLSASRQTAIVKATYEVAPSVVGIVVTQMRRVRRPTHGEEFFNFFFGHETMPRYRQVESIGSGVVISEDGMILTSYHVVQNAAKLYVNFPDGRRLEGEVIGHDELTDLAVIAVEGNDFKPVKFGNSDHSLIGEWSIAIGNPFLNFINDAHPTVTVGVISALDRNFAPSEGVYYQNMIQTDAAINPGNSGGPLVNASGEVIGINAFIYTGSRDVRGSVGMGFAIPINRARKVARELIDFGQRRQVWTGISVQDLNRSVALALGHDGLEGVVIVSIQEKSPGAKAGLRPGDIVKRMGNRTIHSHKDIDGFFVDYFVGDAVTMVIIRGGREIEKEIVLQEFSN
ncbi:HtrA protease/chaperone protein [Chitinispirillum alkaliphilum]|nr:HtrA protease/chaperone protein [Chitinispirillum alkaliphilum]